MIDEIFAGLDPVIPLSLMTQAQKDNALDLILKRFNHAEELEREFKRGREEGYKEGYNNALHEPDPS